LAERLEIVELTSEEPSAALMLGGWTVSLVEPSLRLARDVTMLIPQPLTSLRVGSGTPQIGSEPMTKLSTSWSRRSRSS
jgi:hypothetical protein